MSDSEPIFALSRGKIWRVATGQVANAKYILDDSGIIRQVYPQDDDLPPTGLESVPSSTLDTELSSVTKRNTSTKHQGQSAARDTTRRTVERPDPKQVFFHLLDRAAELQSGETYHYKSFIQRHGRNKLFHLANSSVPGTVWDNVILGEKLFDPNFFRNFRDQNFSRKEAGWYLVIIVDENDPKFQALYVGQTNKSIGLRARKFQHISRSKSNKSTALLYSIWRKNRPVPGNRKLPRNARFMKLGVDRGKFGEHDTGLFLNIMEMFFALMLQTLAYNDLVDWLPEDVIIRHGFVRLNLGLPIHQYLSDDARFASSRLCRSNDPETRATAQASVLSALRMANTALRHVNYKPVTSANRTRGKHFFVYFRETDTLAGDPPVLMVRCRKCNCTSTDENAYFMIRTGAYVVRRQPCRLCGGDSESGLSQFDPVDKALPNISRQAFDKTKDKTIYLPSVPRS